MTLRLFMTIVILLAACASPAPEFFGAQQTRLELGGIRFAVFHRGNRAEAIRLDSIPRSRHREMPVLLVQAMEQATGCTVIRRTLAGDTTEIRASLQC